MPRESNLSARKSTVADVYHLAPRLRSADMKEIKAARDFTPADALIDGLRLSDPHAFTIVSPSEEPLAMFGTCPTADESYRFIWLLGSEKLITDHRTEFLRESRRWVERLHHNVPVLGNYVSAENRVHIRWLKWVGATFVGETLINGTRFLEFMIL